MTVPQQHATYTWTTQTAHDEVFQLEVLEDLNAGLVLFLTIMENYCVQNLLE